MGTRSTKKKKEHLWDTVSVNNISKFKKYFGSRKKILINRDTIENLIIRNRDF